VRKTLVTLGLLAAPRAALACPVCFGQSDSPLAAGVNMGIFMMLGIVAVVLSAFAAFFVYLMRRARQSAEAPPQPPYDFGSDPRKGTARC
jgi:hypothetical protein